MPNVSLMLKPSSSACNLKCGYCFYHSLAATRETASCGTMQTDTLDNVLKGVFEYAHGGNVYISFQGGEPLLRGKDFFIYAAESVARHNVLGSKVSLAVQTNGTLIDDEWCDIFIKYGFLLGVSLDGYRDADDERVYIDGKPSFDKVLDNIELLQYREVPFNTLTVVTKFVAENIARVYNFLVSRGLKHLQFIPCLKPFDGDNRDIYMSKELYADYLKQLFDLYYADFARGNYVSIRHFDNLVGLAAHRMPEQCGLTGRCSTQFVIEANGDVYPCDFYCLDDYLLGNANASRLSDLAAAPAAAEFINDSLPVEDKCKRCEYYGLCRNGCKRERLCLDRCFAYKSFLPYALPRLIAMAKLIYPTRK